MVTRHKTSQPATSLPKQEDPVAGSPAGRFRPGNRLQTRSRGKQPRETHPRAMVRDRGVPRCVSGHFSGTCVEPQNGAEFRQAERRG